MSIEFSRKNNIEITFMFMIIAGVVYLHKSVSLCILSAFLFYHLKTILSRNNKEFITDLL